MSTSLTRLKLLFHSVASLTLATAAAAACGDGSSPEAATANGIDNADFTDNVCQGTTYEPLAGVTPASPSDYLELREQYEGTALDGGAPEIATLAREGTPCATAADRATCNAALAALRSADGWSPVTLGDARVGRRYLAHTKGDAVSAVTSLDALASFLSPIESAKDAALLLKERGHGFDCSRANARKTASGWELITRTGFACGEGTHLDENRVAVGSAGEINVVETVVIKRGSDNCAVGRRPEGFSPDAPRGDGLGASFAVLAQLEAASVHAFEQLARELERHGAPACLVREARRSAWDEVRHAYVMKQLAERFGHGVRAPHVGEAPARDLFALALDNAVEGCVRETFGALQATLQAARAEDAQIARVMRGIAEDETRHAALSWDIAAWVEPLLDDDQRAQLRRAQAGAVEALASDLATEQSDDAVRLAGAPRASESIRMLREMRAHLWAA